MSYEAKAGMVTYKEALDRVERLRGRIRLLMFRRSLAWADLSPLLWQLRTAEYELATWPDGVPF